MQNNYAKNQGILPATVQRRTWVLSLWLLLCLMASSFAVLGQTVTSDKDDYVPGEIATITGTGWLPAETVFVEFKEEPDYPDFHKYYPVADENGNWVINYDIEVRHIGVKFIVTAIGQQSGAKATTVFTDGNIRIRTNRGSITVEATTYISSANCGGTGSTPTLTENIGSTNQGNLVVAVANENQSAFIKAPQFNNQGDRFNGWTTANGNLYSTPNNDKPYEICIIGKGGVIDFTANYTTCTAPTSLSYSTSTASYCLGTRITDNTPSVTGSVTSYSISPALPAGLTLNTTTGVISGTPTASAASANYTITASGCNSSTTAVINITVPQNVGTPTFTAGATSTRCQGAATVTYGASATNSTGISYSLDATSLAAGNTINSSTGAVTYLANFSGTATITASAAGCNGPTTATHTVTVTPTVSTPSPISGGTFTRCQGAGTDTYTTIAANATGYNWTITPAAGTITNGGVVTWDADFSGTATISVTATGCNGPSAQVSAEVAVNSKPVITVPANITVNNEAGKCGATVSAAFGATATGVPAPSIKYFVGDAEVPSTYLFPVGTTTVTATATNTCGSHSKPFTVTVKDAQKPVFTTSPVAANRSTASNSCSYTVNDAEFNAAAGDNCAVTSLTYALTGATVVASNTANTSLAGVVLNKGVTTITWTAKDAAGNTETHSFEVTVVDDVKPTAVAKDISVQLDATGKATITAADVNNGSSDNCTATDQLTLAISQMNFDCSHAGKAIPVTLKVTDASGNFSEATAQITVKDEVKPVVSAKLAYTLNLDASGAATLALTDVLTATSTDACGIKSEVLSKTLFNCADITNSPVSVTLTVTDNNDNVTTTTIAVSVKDETAPALEVKNATIYVNASGNASLSVADVKVSSTDNCGVVSEMLSQTDFSCANLGDNTVTLTVKDAAGNTTAKTMTVRVVDEVKPVAKAKNITVQLDANGAASITAAQVNDVSSDNCTAADQLTLAISKESFDCSNAGKTVPVTLTVTDASGNFSEATAQVTVVDDVKPTALAKNVTVKLSEGGSLTAAAINNGSSDNCSAVTLSIDKTSFSCDNLGANEVTLTVTDAAGNKNTTTATVTVVDDVAPVAKAQAVTVKLSEGGKLTAEQVNNGSSDNCGAISLSIDKTSFSCANLGENTVTLTVTDASNNSHSTIAQVTVVDDVKPIAPALADVTGECTATANAPTTTDNCAGIITGTTTTVFPITKQGTTVVTWSFNDGNGNTTTATQNVVVKDVTKPVAQAKNITIQLDATGKATITAAQVNNGSTDNCTAANDLVLSLNNTSFTCANVGANTVTLTVKDAVGNESTITATVTVEEIAKPVIGSFTFKQGTTTLSAPNVAINSSLTVEAPISGTSPTTSAELISNAGTLATATGSLVSGTTYRFNFESTQLETTGVYTLVIKARTSLCTEVTAKYEYVVIFDQGMVTGGGWINSPAGAYTAEPNLTGRANFGFVSKYQKGSNVPTGNTEFQFHAGSLNFKSTVYEWLTVAGAKAQFKGKGTINGGTEVFGFMLTAVDGQINGGGGTDKFRIKIWRFTNESDIIYDNQVSSDKTDSAEPTTAISGGSIVIHSDKNNKREEAEGAASLKEETGNVTVFPNPFEDRVTIDFGKVITEDVIVTILDTKGAVIYQKNYKASSAATVEVLLPGLNSGVYYLQSVHGKDRRVTKIVKF